MPITIRTGALKLKDDVAYYELDILSEEAKLVIEYVTPEMYGAIGDGVTDDTVAWQSAVNSGKSVIALHKKYKCGKITVVKNIAINCNGADFVCTDTTLFDCIGSVKATLTGQSNYAANSYQYAINDSQYSSYTGMAMLQGTNNFEQTRSYYSGGFVCTFTNGILDGCYPIDVTNGTNNVSVLIVEPITVAISGIGSITYSGESNSNKNWVHITYGLNCIVQECSTKLTDFYCFINIDKCINCSVKNIKVSGKVGTTGTNSYLVAFNDSSFCSVKDSYLFNWFWHCITTGGTYLCYHNVVENCELKNVSGASFVDHPNGIGSVVRNCVSANIGIGGMGIVDNCIIEQSASGCHINIFPSTSDVLTGATITNIWFCPESSSGITIRANPYVDNLSFYIDGIYISNVKSNKRTVTPTIRYGIDTVISERNASFTIGNIIVTDVIATTDFDITSANVDRTNEHIVVR